MNEIQQLIDRSMSGDDTPAQITIDLINIANKINTIDDIFNLKYNVDLALAKLNKSLTFDINILNELKLILETWQNKQVVR